MKKLQFNLTQAIQALVTCLLLTGGQLSTAQSITVVSPNGGEQWQTGYNKTITWVSSGVSNINIEYTDNAGATWNTITVNQPNTGSYVWNVNATPSYYCKVRITSFTDANTLDTSDAYFITGPVVSASAGDDTLICYGASIQLNTTYQYIAGVGSGGPPPPPPLATYEWSPTVGLSNGFIANPVASPTVTTSYTVTINIGTASAVDQVVVHVNPAMDLVLTATNVSCYGNYDGEICVGTNGGTPPFSYAFSNYSFSGNCIYSLNGGTYTITVTDDNQCTDTAIAVVNENLPYAVSFNYIGNGVYPDTIQTLVSGGCPPYQYSWANGNNTPSLLIMSGGQYNVTITDSCGCQSLLSYNTPYQLLLNTYSNGQYSNCVTKGHPIYLTWSGMYTSNSVSVDVYDSLNQQWSNLLSSQQTSGTFVWTAPNSIGNKYKFRVKDTLNNVFGTTSPYYQVTNQLYNVGISQRDTIICTGDSIIVLVVADSSHTLVWQPSTPQKIYQFANSQWFIFTDTMAGTYQLTITDTLGNYATCRFAFETVTKFTIKRRHSPWNNECGEIIYACGDMPISSNIVSLGNRYVMHIWIDADGDSAILVEKSIAIDSLSIDTNQCLNKITLHASGGYPPYSYSYDWGTSSLSQSDSTYYINQNFTPFFFWVTDTFGCSGYLDTSMWWFYPFNIYTPTDHPCVWPGDADYSGTVDNYDLLPIGIGYGQSGFARSQQSIIWNSYSADDWFQYLIDSTNYKHIDCNGNGTINADDTLAIVQNFGLTHPRSGWQEPRGGVPELRVELMPDTVADGQIVTAHLYLGDANIPATHVYGLAFTFNFDPLVVDSNEYGITFSNNSWLCNNATDHIDLGKKLFGQGEIRAALTRIDHSTRSGNGEIGTVNMKITTGNINGKDLSYYTMRTYITDLVVIDELGHQLQFDAGADTAIVAFEPSGLSNIGLLSNIKIYPNPSKQQVTISGGSGLINSIQIFNAFGQELINIPYAAVQLATVNCSELPQAVYTVVIRSDSGTGYAKFIKE